MHHVRTVEGLSALFAAYGLAAIFAVLLLKEAGLPIPVPSDLLMITAGVQAATGLFGLRELALAMLVAVAVGSTVQFLLVRSAGRAIVYRLARYVGLQAERLDAFSERLRSRGAMGVFVGLNLPGARAGVIAAAGLAGLSFASFSPAAIAGESTFHAWHIALGFVIGPTAATLLDALGVQLVAGFAAFAALGAVGWVVVRARRVRVEPTKATGGRQWTEAACPACLASAILERRTLW